MDDKEKKEATRKRVYKWLVANKRIKRPGLYANKRPKKIDDTLDDDEIIDELKKM